MEQEKRERVKQNRKSQLENAKVGGRDMAVAQQMMLGRQGAFRHWAAYAGRLFRLAGTGMEGSREACKMALATSRQAPCMLCSVFLWQLSCSVRLQELRPLQITMQLEASSPCLKQYHTWDAGMRGNCHERHASAVSWCLQVAAKAGALPATLKIAATLTGSGTNSKAAGPKRLPREKRKELREEVRQSTKECVTHSPSLLRALHAPPASLAKASTVAPCCSLAWPVSSRVSSKTVVEHEMHSDVLHLPCLCLPC
jgi:hypothetical protein